MFKMFSKSLSTAPIKTPSSLAGKKSSPEQGLKSGKNPFNIDSDCYVSSHLFKNAKQIQPTLENPETSDKTEGFKEDCPYISRSHY